MNKLVEFTFEEIQDLEAYHGEDIETEIAEMLMYEINVEHKVAQGWRKVQINSQFDADALKWIKINFKGAAIGLNGSWCIEYLDDYMAFILRYSE